MRILLDTNVLLWSVGQPGRLTHDVRDQIDDPDNEVLFSAASIWEMAIKLGRGRVDFRIDPGSFAAEAVRVGLVERPVRADVAAMVATLPPIHRDPFDRLIVAQALSEPARLYTSDVVLAGYSELVTVIRRSA